MIFESLPEISFPFLLCNPRKGGFSCTELLEKPTKPDGCLAVPSSDLLPHVSPSLRIPAEEGAFPFCCARDCSSLSFVVEIEQMS